MDEAERSLHDALCVVRSLIKMRFIIAGGGAPEIELSIALSKYAKELTGLFLLFLLLLCYYCRCLFRYCAFLVLFQIKNELLTKSIYYRKGKLLREGFR